MARSEFLFKKNQNHRSFLRFPAFSNKPSALSHCTRRENGVVSINDTSLSNNATPFLYYGHQSFGINIKFAKKLVGVGVEVAPSAKYTKGGAS